MTRPDLNALAERVEQGGGHDVRLQFAIAEAIAPTPDGADLLVSIDAVETLRARLLPGTMVRVEQRTGYWVAVLSPASRLVDLTSPVHASTEPRARLAAVLRALAAKEG